MSRSKPRQEYKNPAKKFIEFAGDKGIFSYYDKEKGENVQLEYPIIFLVLDELSTITGFNKKNNAGIYSNEIHNINKEVLTVKVFGKDEVASGLYKDIRLKIKDAGGKYAKSIYVMMFNEEKEAEIVNIKLTGSALNAWIEFVKTSTDDIYKDCAVKITGTTHEKNGSIEYEVPNFFTNSVKAETAQIAYKLDDVLQKYFMEYKSEQIVEDKEIPTEAPVKDDPDNEMPF